MFVGASHTSEMHIPIGRFAGEHMQPRRKQSRSETREAIRTAQLQWVEQLKQLTGKSISGIARDAGLATTTLTELTNPKKKGTLSPLTIQALTESTGIQPPFPTSGAATSVPMPEIHEEGALYVPSETETALRQAVDVLIAGRTDAHPWVMNTDILALAGIRKGDIVVIDQSLTARDGDVVCAQIEVGLGAQTVFRLYQAPNLVGASFDPNAVRAEPVNGTRVRIVGVMTDLLRSRS
jgi:SOS-response transcriptional repressor LexA